MGKPGRIASTPVPLAEPEEAFRGRSPTSFADALRPSVTTVSELEAYLRRRGIDPTHAGIDRIAAPRVLPIRVPQYYLDLIDWSDPNDPLRRQVLPIEDESAVLADDLRDPIGDD